MDICLNGIQHTIHFNHLSDVVNPTPRRKALLISSVRRVGAGVGWGGLGWVGLVFGGRLRRDKKLRFGRTKNAQILSDAHVNFLLWHLIKLNDTRVRLIPIEGSETNLKREYDVIFQTECSELNV